MPKKKAIVPNAFLNEFVYTCLYNVTQEQKKNLSKATLKILSTAARAKAFASNSTKDEKEVVLTELGYQWGTIIFPKGVQSVNALKKLMKEVEEGRTATGLSHLVGEKIFITTDKETAFYLGLAAASISHKNYFMNLDLQKTGHALKKWSKRVNNETNEDILEAIEFSDAIDRLIAESISMGKYCEGFLGIMERDLVVLQYLSENRHIYMDKDRIEGRFKGTIKGTGVTTALKKLYESDYIRKHINTRPPKFTITASGIDVITRFRNRVLNTIN